MRALAAVWLIGLGVGACSADDAGPATTSSTTSDSPSATTSGSAAAPVAPVASPPRTPPDTAPIPGTGAPTATDAAITTRVAAPGSTVPTSGTSDTLDPSDALEWCLRAAELNELASDFRQLDAGDTDAVRWALGEILDRLTRIEPVTPPGLADDLSVSADAFRLLDAALADVGYDLAEADLTELEARTEAITSANERIRAYNHDECGLDAGVTGSSPP